MVNSFQTHVTRQALRQVMVNTLLADPLLAPDMRRNFDGSPTTHARMRAERLADATLDVLMKDATGILMDHLQTRVAAPTFNEALAARYESLKGTAYFTAAQPNSAAASSMASDIGNLLNNLKVAATGEILNSPTSGSANAQHHKPAKLPKPKATLSGESDQPSPVDVDALRATIRSFFATQQSVQSGPKGGRPAFGTTLDNRINALTDAALLALAPNAGGTLSGWKSTVTKMAKPDSMLSLCLQHEITHNRTRYPQCFFHSIVEGGQVNDTPTQLAEQLCAHLQQWMKVEKTDAAAIDPNAPKSAELASKLAGKDKDGRAA